MSDLLDMNKINSLPHPLYVRLLSDSTWWPLYMVCVETGLLKIDVYGKLDRSEFAEVMELMDSDGGKHDPDDFYND